MSRTVTAREAAAELGIAERTVRRWIGAGTLAAEKRGGAFVIDLAAARETHSRSRAGLAVGRVTELAELRGRYLEVCERLARAEHALRLYRER